MKIFYANNELTNLTIIIIYDFFQENETPKPVPRSKFDTSNAAFNLPDLPDLPSVPDAQSSTLDNQTDNNDDIDFDDLTKRFEELKKKK